MNTIQIEKCMRQNKFTKNIFKGVFPADKIPHQKIIKPVLYIINTHNSSKPGEHWLAVYITANKIELFDTGGRELKNHIYLKKLREYHSNKKFAFNRKQVQSFSSDLCGEFVCLYGLIKSKNISTIKFIRYFNSKNLNNNNFLVLDLFKKYFNCTNIVCKKKFIKIKNKKVQVCSALRSSSVL